MDCFFLFDFSDGELFFHVEYCNDRAVHTMSGSVGDVDGLYSATGTMGKEELLKYLTDRFSSNNRFFDFLQQHGIAFTLKEKTYADSSSDV